MSLIDLQKAFDTIGHKILLGKMKCIGFSDKTIKWFHSYLTNRVTFVSLDAVFSEAGIINCGVPQGFILGPLLFLLYINDIYKYIPVCRRVSFINIRTSKIKNVFNLRKYTIDLLIISYQFILVKIKQNAFFLVGRRTYLSLI